MKRLTLALASLMVFACASGDGASPTSKVPQPDFDVVQLSGPAEQGYPQGLFQVELAFSITNNATEPITLTQLDLQGMGDGGPYLLRSETYYFNETIAPKQTRNLVHWANAFSRGDWRNIDAHAPVSIRGVARFSSASGKVQKIFMKILNQDLRGR